ncbi:hypothetical protein GCM10007857_76630 [Bradyrhizobium iriomotense]|uniref:Tyr recombinase domain-containing protein n=1 Tax=Bradyrhizobium iriomotense TaxID=441950 RepID=A0ABQ6BFK1_9BRAD|nr:hypothetical protein GCM10007857_76630 [Bradyrhizobium iriomotense]
MEHARVLSPARRRDLRSAVKRVADLLDNEPSAIVLDLGTIGERLAGINLSTARLTAKRFANIRSDFLAAVRASGKLRLASAGKQALSPAWVALFVSLAGRRAHIGLSRLARYASARGISPGDVDDEVIAGFILAVREGSLHRKPKALHRQVTLIWNEAARDPKLRLRPVTVATSRKPPMRIAWASLPASFRRDVDNHLSWCGGADPFAANARSRSMEPTTLRLRRDQIHAAVSALVASGVKPANISSLAEVLTPENFKRILRQRLEAGGSENAFNHDMGATLVQIAQEWVKVDATALTELKRLFGKVPPRAIGLTKKNKQFLRQFDDPRALRRLVALPDRLWSEVRRDSNPNFRTLAKAQAALAIATLIYMPLRLQNLARLAFGTHLFVRGGSGAISTLELSRNEVKNKTELAYDIPPHVVKMLIEYRERIAPRLIGHRPTQLFVRLDGALKSPQTVAWLIRSHVQKRTGIVLTSHQFRHLGAKVLLDAEPGAFETARQLLGQKNLKTTVNFYAGIDSRRAARHQQHLIEKAIAALPPLRPQTKSLPPASY